MMMHLILSLVMDAKRCGGKEWDCLVEWEQWAERRELRDEKKRIGGRRKRESECGGRSERGE